MGNCLASLTIKTICITILFSLSAYAKNIDPTVPLDSTTMIGKILSFTAIPGLKLTEITEREKLRFAKINNKWIKEGESILGYRVSRVTLWGVRLVKPGKVVEVYLSSFEGVET